MQSPDILRCILRVAAGGLFAAAPAAADVHWERPDASFGQEVTEEDLVNWDIAIVTPTGANLPEGHGSVAEGEEVYAAQCQHCHGPEARGGDDYMYGTMVGGIGTMTEDPRVLTPGSMYPYAPILFDYVRRAMPLDNPHSLEPDAVYAVSAYIYHLNGLVEEDFVADADTLPAIEMPNQGNFFVDDRPDTANERCMEDCEPIGTVADADAARGATSSGEDGNVEVEDTRVEGGGTGGR
jgi:S-disulfanyl-L-cysteine oxidoreductase SoxD